MRKETLAWSPICVLLVSGCAIHPQPKDVTGISTFDIEQQIRCETRKAVVDLTLTYAATRTGDCRRGRPLRGTMRSSRPIRVPPRH
jgi:hypothetical protein